MVSVKYIMPNKHVANHTTKSCVMTRQLRQNSTIGCDSVITMRYPSDLISLKLELNEITSEFP